METKVNDHLLSALTTFIVAFVVAFTANVGDITSVSSLETPAIVAAISTAARAALKELIVFIGNLVKKYYENK